MGGKTIECRIAGGRLLLPKEKGGDINGELRPMTEADAECFAAWNRDPLAASIPSGVYVVQEIGEEMGGSDWAICSVEGDPVFGVEPTTGSQE